MSFLIDSDICSAYLRGDGKVQNRFLQHTGGLFVSAITVAELYTWVYRVAQPSKRMEIMTALHFDYTVVTHYTRHFSMLPGLRLADWL
jgi:tRNA(fMet)-specific endonuclease VapC